MYFCEAGIIFDFSEHVEQLDYAVTVPSVSGLETARFFVEHPIYGTVGYPTYEDACKDMYGILGFGQFLDSVESMVNAGFVGDHYVFDNQNMLVKVRSDHEFWTWTPEMGIVYDPEPEQDTRPNRKQKRAARRVQNARHKVSDRKHGKHARDVRKAIWEDTADWDDMPNNTYYRWDDKRKTFTSPKKPKVHRVKKTFRDKQNAAFRDRLTDITPIERLTASVLAEVKQYHGMVGCTWNVFYLTEAICQREQLPYPDYAYVQEYGKTVKLVLEYFDSYEDEDYSTHEYIDLRA